MIVALQGLQVTLRLGEDPVTVKKVVQFIVYEINSWVTVMEMPKPEPD